MIVPGWLGEDLARIERLLVATAGASPHPLVSEPALHLIKAGGKRIRPALVLLCSRAGQPARAATDHAAVAVELVHLATLYHDDVIDETETRRGVPTAHSKWGVEVAVLAGDYLFACGSAMGALAGGAVPGILARAIAEVCEGQIAETAVLSDPRRPLTDYLDTIGKKTAALFRAACELGGSTAGLRDGDLVPLVSFGNDLGLAFQIVDDLLDLIGDPGITGKVPGTDLREGVFTAPVLIAAERDPDFARLIESGRRDLGDLLPRLRSSGAVDEALALARRYAASARSSLDETPPGPWRDALHEMVDAVLDQV